MVHKKIKKAGRAVKKAGKGLVEGASELGALMFTPAASSIIGEINKRKKLNKEAAITRAKTSAIKRRRTKKKGDGK